MKTAVDARGRSGSKQPFKARKQHAGPHPVRAQAAVQTNTPACHAAFDAIGAPALRTGTGLPSFLQRRIDFVEDRSAASGPADAMYNLRATPEREAHAEAAQDDLADVPLSWASVAPAGPGLSNLGNTCFLNSVLQCLTHTPPLANYLLRGTHGRTCALPADGGAAFCVLCALERHVRRCLGPGRPVGLRSIAPTEIVGHLRLIARHMHVGRQEDAHEFLRYVIDAMQRASDARKAGGAEPGARTQAARLVDHVFGGELCSEVHCLSCGKTSAKREPFLDISLDVRIGAGGDAPTVAAAFANYMRTERLAGANRYRCERDAPGAQGCDALVDAEKHVRIERPPRVLTVHLKRFQVSAFGVASKISRDVEFGERLDIGAHCAAGASYRLYAVLVHEGQTCNSGHYHAFVRAPNDVWHSMNDSSVHQVSLATVLKQRAYLLFYVRDDDAARGAAAAAEDAPLGVADGPSPKRARSSPRKAARETGAECPIVAKTMWHRTDAGAFSLAAFEAAQAVLSHARTGPAWRVRPL